MELHDFNSVPAMSACQNTAVDALVSGCDGGPLQTEEILVLHHDWHYTVLMRRDSHRHFGKPPVFWPP